MAMTHIHTTTPRPTERSGVGDAVNSWSPLALGVAAIGSLGLVAVAAELGGTDDGLSLCTVRHLTGGYCPGCGASRAARHLLHGDAVAAWRDHPWVLLAAAQLIVLGTVFAASVARRRRPALRLARASRLAWASRLAVVNAVALVVIWVARLGSGTIPSPL